MIFGTTLTALTFVALILSITAYYLYHLRQENQMLKMARIGFYSSVGLIVTQSGLLLWGILNQQYDWIYVFSYSSKDLPLYYKIATFWAGQEGTFLLWLLFGSLFGIAIIRSRKEDEPLVMSFMNLVQAYIVVILIKKNPFSYVWEANPAGFPVGMVPFDGNGLNPLLQDPWMTIHPPILFAGYSSTMILFAFAMSALIRNKHNDWIKSVYPFALFVGLTLGAGIILGGYWAYTTLGWGGYWAWDPVENSSLIPWLISLALIHGIIIQRRQGGFKRINLALAILAFFFVLYGSFLTRSGVLTDFSVHSFSESELTPYLIGFLFLFGGGGAITYLFKVNKVKGKSVSEAFFTRELFMAFGIISLLLLAAFTFVGTSWPMFSGIFADKPSSVEIEAYNSFGGPIAIIIGMLIALAPVFSWRRDSRAKLKSIILHFGLSLVAGFIMYLAGIRDIIPLLISTIAIFILMVNGEIIFRMILKKNYNFGGYLAHVGIGFMLIGIITSSVYDYSTKITLPQNTATNIFGYDLNYIGKKDSPDGKDKVLININDDQSFAKFYWSEYSQAYMVAPSVKNTLFQDLYISPIQLIPANQNQAAFDEIRIKKGDTKSFEDKMIQFVDYDMASHASGSSDMTIAAIIRVYDTQGKFIKEVRPSIGVSGNQRSNVPAAFTDQRNIAIQGVLVDQKELILGVSKLASNNPHSGKELLAVEVSVKPLINVLWLGTIIMVLGFFTAIYNRTRKQRL